MNEVKLNLCTGVNCVRRGGDGQVQRDIAGAIAFFGSKVTISCQDCLGNCRNGPNVNLLSADSETTKFSGINDLRELLQAIAAECNPDQNETVAASNSVDAPNRESVLAALGKADSAGAD